MKKYNDEEFIVSITSYGKRIKYIAPVIKSILSQKTNFRFHVFLIIEAEDEIPEEIKELEDYIEIFKAPKNIGSHSKYYWAMKKYYNLPIITFDDDFIIPNGYLNLFFLKYKSLLFKSVICGCAVKIQRNSEGILPLSMWCHPLFRLGANESSILAMPEGFAGILYPPYAFNLDNVLEEIEKYPGLKYDDDLYLKVLELREGLLVTQIHYPFIMFYSEFKSIIEIHEFQLHNTINKDYYNRDNLANEFSKEMEFNIKRHFAYALAFCHDFGELSL